jgi:drug/metabolite transporter (DMT)-like permease
MTGPILIVVAAILWALDGLLRRSLYSLPPLTIVFLEHLVGLVLLIPWMPKVVAEVKTWSIKQWSWISWVAIFSGVFGTLWFTTALLSVQFVPFSVVFLLQKLQPVFVFVTAMLLLGERPSLKRLGWSALALIAAYFVTFPMGQVNFQTGGGTIVAAGYALAAAFAWGTSTVFSRLLLQNQSNTSALTVRFAVASLVAGLMLWAMPAANKVMFATPAQLGTLFIIALSTGMVGLAIYYKGLAKTAPSVATILELVFPLLAVLIDAKVYGVVLHPTQYLAALVLLLAGVQVARTGKNGLPVTFASVKVHGDGRGKTLGFPTINLQIPWNLVLTPGIYAVWVWINGVKYAGALHYGSVPTFNKIEQTLEIFVLTKKNLTNAEVSQSSLKVMVVEKLREVLKFDSSEALIAQMHQDVAQTKRLLLD